MCVVVRRYIDILITSAIQRINGESLKEHWAAQRSQVYKQQYQRLQHDTGLKYEMEFFLSSVSHDSTLQQCILH